MNLKLTTSLLLILVCLQLPAQNPDKEWQQLMSLEIQAEFVTQDALGNIYLILQNGNILKLDAVGTITHDYRDRRFGKPTLIDATNPMKIIVIFPEFSTVIFLDNNLNKKGLFRLSDEGLHRVSAIAFSSDNNFWVYDEVNMRLVKLAENTEVIIKSEDFQMLFEEDIKPRFMLERGNMLYITDSENGIYVFDLFANYSGRIPFTGVKHFSIDGNWLYYHKNNKLEAYHLRTLQSVQTNLPEGDLKMLHFKKNMLVALTANALTLYRKQ